MGDIRSAIHDDIEEYERLCTLYGEQPELSLTAQGCMLVNPYCKHADKLKAMDWQNRVKNLRK